MYRMPGEVDEGLERASSYCLAEIICGSNLCYGALPEISDIQTKDLASLMVGIDSKVRRTGLSDEKIIDEEEKIALYVGLVTGFVFANSKTMFPMVIHDKLLLGSVAYSEIPSRALSLLGIGDDSNEARIIKQLADEIPPTYSSWLGYLPSQASKGLSEQSRFAIRKALKTGYNAYFRLVRAVPGNTGEEDQIILNQLLKKSNQSVNSENSTKKTSIAEEPGKSLPQKTNEVVSIHQHKDNEKKFWLDENGIVKCPGDACPQNCSIECPIYAQTIALQKLTLNDFEGAAKLLRSATITEPSFADAWNNLAACYGQMGDHKNAFAAYQRSYELLQKPNPLYGMAVATKNMKDLALAKFHAETYVKKFGSDERIKSLIAEISENELFGKIAEKASSAHEVQDTPQAQKKQEVPAPAASPAKGPPVKADAVAPQKKTEPELPVEDMRRFGKFVLLLLDADTREAGYAGLERMVDKYPEACILTGQYYNVKDKTKAKAFFKKAADKGIAEAQWDYSQTLPHSDILDFSVASDREYLKYCLAAAEGGCADAANEMGNICHREGFYEESTYWYGMAYCLEHPEDMVSLRGITNEWRQNGISNDFVAHIDGFTEERRATSLLIYKMFDQSLGSQDLDDLMKLALKGENLAGFILGEVMEQGGHDDVAYKAYNALAFENHPHALRCYADMLLNGKGTAKDIEGAFLIYEMAALRGNAVSMFAMGQKAVKDGDKNLAACWFGQAYSRGFELASEWLSRLV